MKVDIDIFIQEHTHINYCEAVIDPEGLITYVSPSHVETLVRESGLSKQEVYDKMDISDSPIHWLVDYTSCVCVWTGGYILPKFPTYSQAETLTKLVAAGLVSGKKF